eukprot:TRINITY_DN23079_c0_g1_i1.p1 TRINITY_DN23079_c0_g1~~TRINITY_DN23079_c0_g1_i1.p1  ORF type:complete len:109 (+),score=26.01 TRINITY_DN23079_c0_g1_i1:83-409(+)
MDHSLESQGKKSSSVSISGTLTRLLDPKTTQAGLSENLDLASKIIGEYVTRLRAREKRYMKGLDDRQVKEEKDVRHALLLKALWNLERRVALEEQRRSRRGRSASIPH